MSHNRIAVEDMGSVRKELIAYLLGLLKSRRLLGMFIATQLGDFYRETQLTHVTIRKELVADDMQGIRPILARGVQRGELDPKKLTPMVAILPMAYLRNLYITDPIADPKKAVTRIVDEAFLFLVGK
jgi:hypothetical protein